MLGLDGAGKSSILLGLTGSTAPFAPQPNEGFNVVCLTTAKFPMSFWESKLTYASSNLVLGNRCSPMEHPYLYEAAYELFRRRLTGLNLWFQ